MTVLHTSIATNLATEIEGCGPLIGGRRRFYLFLENTEARMKIVTQHYSRTRNELLYSLTNYTDNLDPDEKRVANMLLIQRLLPYAKVFITNFHTELYVTYGMLEQAIVEVMLDIPDGEDRDMTVLSDALERFSAYKEALS